MTRLLLTWLRSAWAPVLLVLACVGMSAVILPRWFNTIESLSSERLEIETTIRSYLCLAMGLTLAFAGAYRWPHWSRGMKQTWGALVFLLALLITLFCLDGTWLWNERSWIKYPTAAALAGAGFAGFALVGLRRKFPLRNRQSLFWLVIAGGFLFLSADESFELHEGLGDWMESSAALAFVDQDWITLAYALIGASVLAGYWILLGRHTPVREQWLLRGYMTAVAVFAMSQICDTFNPQALDGLKTLSARLAENGHAFPDVWFGLFRPRQLLNGVEELLECIAAALFMIFTLRMVGASWRAPDDDDQPREPQEPQVPIIEDALQDALELAAKRPPFAVRYARRVIVVLATTLLILGWEAATVTTPFVGTPGIGTTLSPSAAGSLKFQSRIVLRNGETLRVHRGDHEVVRRTSHGEVLERWPVRNMLRGVRGVSFDEEGRLAVLTRPSRKKSFMPELVWMKGMPEDYGLMRVRTIDEVEHH